MRPARPSQSMRARALWAPWMMLLLSSSGCADDPSPWSTGRAEDLGFDRTLLEQAAQRLESRGTESLLVIRNDRIACERYADGVGPEKAHYTASLAKALVGGLSLLLAVDSGQLSLDDAAARYIPAWSDDPVKSRITIRHLVTHSSGIEDAEEASLPHDQLPGWKGEFWKRGEPDPFSIAVREAPVLFEPGTDWEYSNPGMAALAYAVTASLRDSPYTDIEQLLRQRIFEPIGISEREARVGYGRKFSLEGLSLVANWGGANFTPRAVARIGRLMLRRGNWQGRQLFQPEYLDAPASLSMLWDHRPDLELSPPAEACDHDAAARYLEDQR